MPKTKTLDYSNCPMQNITRPFLSVVVPTRDRGEWLDQCIDAILRQSFTDFEVVIVDNDSNDDGKTKKVFEDKSKDSRLRYKRTGGLGMAANWQVAVEEARGEYIVVCSDKLLLQNWLLESLGKLLAAGEFDAVVWQIGDYAKKSEKNIWSKQSIVYGEQIMSSAMSCSWRLLWNAGPRGMNSAIRNSLVSVVKEKLGVPICRMICPDFSMALSLSALNCKILETDIVGSVFLPNAHGNGMQALLAKNNESLKGKFEFPELDCLPVKYLTAVTGIAYDILSTIKITSRSESLKSFNWEGFYINLIHEAVNAIQLGGFSEERTKELIQAIASNSMRFRLSLFKTIIEQETTNLLRGRKSRKSQLVRMLNLLKFPFMGMMAK
jgi:glycosyltransferase involved in cell wall biosynthesis